MNRYLMAPSGGPRHGVAPTPPTARCAVLPQLGQPTGTRQLPNNPPPSPNRGLAMPKRKRTRAQDRAYRIEHERALNHARHAADPPPF